MRMITILQYICMCMLGSTVANYIISIIHNYTYDSTSYAIATGIFIGVYGWLEMIKMEKENIIWMRNRYNG